MKEVSCNLSNCFLCRFCVPEWKEAIAVKKRTIDFKKGKRIFSEGDKVQGIYFIYSGSVKVHKQWVSQKELIIRFAGEGDILGHRGLGGNDIYPISATALENTRACFIDNDFLEATLTINHPFTYRIMQFYAAELQKAEKRMRDLAHMDVKGKIADALLEIHSMFGIDDDKYITVALSRQDIASYAGTTYETVFKFFKELTDDKTIVSSGKKIRINDLDKLKTFIDNKT